MRLVTGPTSVIPAIGLLLIVTLSCGAPQVTADHSPDKMLGPGLHRLHGPDGGRVFTGHAVTEGVRWLDNYAVRHAGTPAAARARYWILRANLDWLTWAYTLPDPAQRLASLEALAKHLGVQSDTPEQILFDVLDALDRQAAGLARLEDNDGAGESAKLLLTMFRNLDRTPAYFDASRDLIEAYAHSPQASNTLAEFGPNALLIVAADLELALSALDDLPYERRPHGLARVAAWDCPVGLSAFAGTALEGRARVLAEHCQWPCPLGAQTLLEGGAHREVLEACETTAGEGVDQYVTTVTMRRMRWFLQLAERVSKAPSELIQQRYQVIERFALALSRQPETTYWTTFGGRVGAQPQPIDLPSVPYARSAPPVALALVVGPESVSVIGPARTVITTYQPPASDPATTGPPTEAAESKRHPLAAPEWLTEGVDEVLGTMVDGARDARAVAPAVIPQLVVDRTVDAGLVVALASWLKERGHPRVELVVDDPALARAGVVGLQPLKCVPPEVVLVQIDSAALNVELPDGQREALPGHHGELPLAALYRKLVPVAAGSPGERLPGVVVVPAAGATTQQLSDVLDGLRYWRAVSASVEGEALLESPIQEEAGRPKLFVGQLLISPGPAGCAARE